MYQYVLMGFMIFWEYRLVNNKLISLWKKKEVQQMNRLFCFLDSNVLIIYWLITQYLF